MATANKNYRSNTYNSVFGYIMNISYRLVGVTQHQVASLFDKLFYYFNLDPSLHATILYYLRAISQKNYKANFSK